MIGRFFSRGTTKHLPLYFFNTLGKEKQRFTKSEHASQVRMYSCGPTVYDRQHVGNLSAAVFADILRRILEKNGYEVKQVINITDFGHLVSDEDEGEDKMTKGMRREGLTLTMENMHEFGTKFMDLYLEDIRALNVATDKITFPRASEYVPAMIAILKTLEEKGYAYKTSDGMYFDTARFRDYGILGGIDLALQKEALEKGARIKMNNEKRNPADFALWKFNKDLGWDASWGKGFPGWHLECSAMAVSILGKQIDIHTGGVEHIPVHHNNEIAQSEAATGKKPFSRFWMHRAHIQMGGAKIAKSTGNTAYLSDVTEHGIHPLSFRYWLLTSHYRQSTNLTWEALEAAQTALLRLFYKMQRVAGTPDAPVPPRFHKAFMERVNDDVDTSGALALLWEHLKDGAPPEDTRAMLTEADAVFGLDLAHPDTPMQKLIQETFGIAAATEDLPAPVRELMEKREAARKDKDWARADTLRDEIRTAGYEIEDAPGGARVLKK